MLANFFGVELNPKGPYRSSGKEKESGCRVLPSLTTREIRYFHTHSHTHTLLT